MKNPPLLQSIAFLLVLNWFLQACSKGSQGPASVAPKASLSFSAGDSLILYSLNTASIQDVNSTHTTLIAGQYPDTSSKKGSLSLRLLGDTTGTYRGDSLLVTYTDGAGKIYYNTKDSSNIVRVDKFAKVYNGVVNGSFSLTVTGGGNTIRFSNGSFIAIYQY